MNINFYTSYFYKIRFFSPNMIPLSTAMWDPKWYHNNKNQDHVYKDKRGVYNGLRYDPFVPSGDCTDKCRGREFCNTKDPSSCEFLRLYYEQISKLGVKSFMMDMESLVYAMRMYDEDMDNPVIVFIFHESPDNPCSERFMVQRWFSDNGIMCEELR